MMPLSLLSRVEEGEVTEAWREEACLLLFPSPPAGGGRVEVGEELLLARLEEGEILCGENRLNQDYNCVCVLMLGYKGTTARSHDFTSPPLS